MPICDDASSLNGKTKNSNKYLENIIRSLIMSFQSQERYIAYQYAVWILIRT